MQSTVFCCDCPSFKESEWHFLPLLIGQVPKNIDFIGLYLDGSLLSFLKYYLVMSEYVPSKQNDIYKRFAIDISENKIQTQIKLLLTMHIHDCWLWIASFIFMKKLWACLHMWFLNPTSYNVLISNWFHEDKN